MSLMTSRLPRLLRRHPRVALAVAAALTLGWLADDWAFHKVPSVELQAWCYTGARPGDTHYLITDETVAPLDKPVSTEFRMLAAAFMAKGSHDRALVDGEKILVTPQFSVNLEGQFADFHGGEIEKKQAFFELSQRITLLIFMKRLQEGAAIDYDKIGLWYNRTGGFFESIPERDCAYKESFVTRDGAYARNPTNMREWLYGDDYGEHLFQSMPTSAP